MTVPLITIDKQGPVFDIQLDEVWQTLRNRDPSINGVFKEAEVEGYGCYNAYILLRRFMDNVAARQDVSLVLPFNNLRLKVISWLNDRALTDERMNVDTWQILLLCYVGSPVAMKLDDQFRFDPDGVWIQGQLVQLVNTQDPALVRCFLHTDHGLLSIQLSLSSLNREQFSIISGGEHAWPTTWPFRTMSQLHNLTLT